MISNTAAQDVHSEVHTGSRYFGVYPALVTEIVDPDEAGRIKIRLPWSPDDRGNSFEVWSRMATLMAGKDRGSWFVPDVGDEVLVAFEGGNPRHPYIVGALWNGLDSPPATMDPAGHNSIKTLRSRNGCQITLDDTQGQEQITIETPAGQRVTLADGPGRIEIEDTNGNHVALTASGITISSAAKLSVEASIVEVSAGFVNVNSGISKYSGVVQVDTLIANNVISASYSPGAGNIW